MNKLEVRNICKSFGRHEVLKDVSMTLNGGSIVGIVGDNGSGKTVLMKIMLGLTKPSSGQVFYNDKILGKDFDILPSVGTIIEKPGFFDEFDGVTNLKMLADIKKIVDHKTILDYFHLVGLRDEKQKVGKYSLGMRQRLGIAQALMENPEVLILDEITTALDESMVEKFYTLINQEKAKGKVILISSHTKKDIEFLSDEVYRLTDGRLNKC